MAIHVAPVVLHIRGGYTVEADVERPLHAMTAHYQWHVVVLINDLGVARLEGLDHGMSGSDYRALFAACKQYGARRAEYRHNGIEKFKDLL